MSEPLLGTASAAGAIERVKYTHDSMIDLIITNPALSQNAIAAHFGYTAAWVSRIFNSDAFQARLAQRKSDIVDPALTLSIEEKLRALADKSLDVVLNKLTLTENPDTALRALEITSKALGYGARQQNLTVQQNFVVALPGKSASAQDWATEHGPGTGGVLLADGGPGLAVPPPPPAQIFEGTAQRV